MKQTEIKQNGKKPFKQQYKRIVLPFNDVTYSTRIFQHAVGLARKMNTKLLVLYCVDESSFIEESELSAQKTAVQSKLEKLDLYCTKLDVKFACEIHFSTIVDAIDKFVNPISDFMIIQQPIKMSLTPLPVKLWNPY